MYVCRVYASNSLVSDFIWPSSSCAPLLLCFPNVIAIVRTATKSKRSLKVQHSTTDDELAVIIQESADLARCFPGFNTPLVICPELLETLGRHNSRFCTVRIIELHVTQFSASPFMRFIQRWSRMGFNAGFMLLHFQL